MSGLPRIPPIAILIVIASAGCIFFALTSPRQRVGSWISDVGSEPTIEREQHRRLFYDDPKTVRSRSTELIFSRPAAPGTGEGDACGAPRTFPRPTEVTFPPQAEGVSRKRRGSKIRRYWGCLRFECASHKEEHCRDPFAATEYDGPNPPCCHHVLRDVMKTFDDAMCELGLEYVVAYGSLLGLVRDDHAIPWTADHDVVVDYQVAKEMWAQRDYFAERFGIRITRDFFLRGCLAENFLNGALVRWRTNKYDLDLAKRGNFVDRFPYLDFFYGEVHPGRNQFVTERGCAYDVSNYFPLRRIPVYGSSFFVPMPGNVLEVLEADYGEGWRVPPSAPSKHGCKKRSCRCKGYESAFMRKWTLRGNDVRWTYMWNSILRQNATVAHDVPSTATLPSTAAPKTQYQTVKRPYEKSPSKRQRKWWQSVKSGVGGGQIGNLG